ncbi:MAG TPA: DNA polymerase I, partial [Deltaproteobacteria bacterium]|nr:DNA polymerase I [Deltaproteobacteria bacterium]
MSEDKKTVYLLDGSSYIHRAYHAIRNLTNSKGFPTNAILGVTKMVMKLMADRNPEYFAVVFDSKGPTFRHKIYEDYKANRPPMPEEMAVQLPLIKEILQKLGIRIMELSGYEADDIIGTMARVSQENGFQVVMVTGDKDFRQLITPEATMWDTMKDRVTDYEAIKEEYGIEPEKFLDVMGLSGDTSDNIPGVRGVGEKTALDLVKQFGSMENLFEHLDEITKKKLRENLEACREQAFLSRILVTIDQFVPVEGDLGALRLGDPSGDELATIFRELEFRGLWDQFASRKEVHSDYRLILSMDELNALSDRIREVGFVSVDTETTSTEPMRADLVGISFCCEKGKAFYLPLTHLYLGVPEQISLEAALPVLKGFLEDGNIVKVGQNIKYDGEVLKRHG